jgi:hypothetical protein
LELKIELDGPHFSIEGLKSKVNGVLFGSDLTNLFDSLQLVILIELEYDKSVESDALGINLKLQLRANLAPVARCETFGP